MSEEKALLDCQVINPKGDVKACVIWLHGLGATSDDFVPIVPQLDIADELGIRFVFPQAPTQAVTINLGYEMPAWYDVLGLDKESRQDEAGVRSAESQIGTLIEKQIESGIPSNKIILAGFSQGGALALHTGLRYQKPLAGIMALSSYLPLADVVADEKSDENKATPVLVIHGTEDAVLPLVAGEMTLEYLQALNYDVIYKTYLMAHEVCADEIVDIADWLKQCLMDIAVHQ